MNIFFNQLILLAFVLSSRQASSNSAVVGNGGNTLFCKDDTGIDQEYTLDFVTEGFGRDSIFREVNSLEQSMEQISVIIDKNSYVLPYFSFQFNTFSKDILNTLDDSRYNFWENVQGPLEETHDQNLERPLPENCLINGKPKLFQAFRRHGSRYVDSGTETTVYKYDEEILSRLKSRPLQLSFLIVHEWLWSISGDVQVNRKINALLHSKAITQMNVIQVQRAFQQAGLNLERIGLFPNEKKFAGYTYETQSSRGSSVDAACLQPRKEHAKAKKKLFAQDCNGRIPSGVKEAHILTENFKETVNSFDNGSRFSCFLNWTFLCVGTP